MLLHLHSFERSLPGLHPGKLPPSYINLGAKRDMRSFIIHDPDTQRIIEADLAQSAPSPPPPPPELSKSGKPLTKKQIKAVSIRMVKVFLSNNAYF